MTEEPVALEALLAARDWMVGEIQRGLSAAERRFLLSLVAAEPEWSLLGVEHLEQLPGLQWKLQILEQLRKVNPKKFAAQSDALAQFVGLSGFRRQVEAVVADAGPLAAHQQVYEVEIGPASRCTASRVLPIPG
jgi:hypothetical protein